LGPTTNDATALKEWRQGDVIPIETAEALTGKSLEPGTICIIATHDCEVSSPDLTRDPHVEILLARPTEEDGNYTHGKNPRRLHLSLSYKDDQTTVEISAVEIYRVDRANLAKAAPASDCYLGAENIRTLATWLGKRYYREAFPDAFNERVRQVQSKLPKATRSSGSLLSGIYIDLDTAEELAEESSYEIQLFATMTVPDYADPVRRSEAQAVFDRILSLFDDARGVDVVNDALLAEDLVSLDDLRRLRRWDWDYLTLREEVGEDPSHTESLH